MSKIWIFIPAIILIIGFGITVSGQERQNSIEDNITSTSNLQEPSTQIPSNKIGSTESGEIETFLFFSEIGQIFCISYNAIGKDGLSCLKTGL